MKFARAGPFCHTEPKPPSYNLPGERKGFPIHILVSESESHVSMNPDVRTGISNLVGISESMPIEQANAVFFGVRLRASLDNRICAAARNFEHPLRHARSLDFIRIITYKYVFRKWRLMENAI